MTVKEQKDKEQKQPYGIDFIDPLFAAALSIGFTHAIMQENWFNVWRMPAGREWFYFGVFMLGVLTVVLSWVGYHESIRSKPLRAYGRFIVDVILVALYVLLLVKFKNFGAVLSILVLIHLFFVIWDIFKIKEYGDPYNQGGREAVTLIWTVIFTLLWVSHYLNWVPEGFLLLFAYISTILYRIHKVVPIGGGIRRVLVGDPPTGG